MMLAGIRSWLSRLTRVRIFTDEKPETPDDIVSIGEYGGGSVAGTDALDRDVQFYFRGSSAHMLAWKVYREMVPAPVVTWGGGKLVLRPKDTPFLLERDVLSRPVYVFNATVKSVADQ